MACYLQEYSKLYNMQNDTKQNSVINSESRDEFRPGATIAVLTLLLAFIVSSIYVLIVGYLNIA